MTPPTLPPPGLASGPIAKLDTKEVTRLRELSTELEAGFLTEMLKHAGVGQVSESFGGGIGEEQFTSFLTQMQADAMAKAGGIGLAEQLFKSMIGDNDVTS